MNKNRRARLQQAEEHLDSAKGHIESAKEHFMSAREIVEDVQCEERESLDNMPDNLCGSERYSKMEDAVDSLDTAITAIDEATEAIESASE